MTFWLDAHLDPELAPWLGSRFRIIAKPLREMDLQTADDGVLIEAARRFIDIVIVTRDADFAEFAKRHGKPPQVLWLRCGNLSTIEMQTWLAGTFPDALRRLESGESWVELQLFPPR